VSAQSETPTPLHARRQGQRMSAKERKKAQEVFLATFRDEGNMSEACRVAGIHIDTPYDWKERYEDFAEEYRIAEIQADGAIDHEIYQRAVVGWEEPQVSAGKLVCYATRKSDAMLTLLAKSRMAKYREKSQVDVNAHVNAQVRSQNVINIDPRSLSSEQLATLKVLAKELKAGEQK